MLLEGAIIVASILHAFAIDAWWDRETRAQRERRLLAALLVEFRQNEVILGQARAEYEQHYMEARQILAWIGQAGGFPDSTEIQPLLAGILQSTAYSLESGTYDGSTDWHKRRGIT